jgi:RNA recognition motif-containing protein
MFQEYGIITRIVIKRHFAFVNFEKNKDALKAIERLNNQRMFGAILKVSPARRTLPKLAQPNSILRGSSGFTANVNVPSRSGMSGTSRETNYDSLARCVSVRSTEEVDSHNFSYINLYFIDVLWNENSRNWK